ncbi:MAG TPA: hypothetical protein VEJ63_04765 [Planctomycetota bacterium]|nr:hypothetical protein [Planctomycetota bacterium]
MKLCRCFDALLFAVLVTCFNTKAQAAAPANDSFAAPLVLSGAAATNTTTNSEGTKETGEPEHAGNAGGASIWYRYTAPASGTISINTNGSTAPDGSPMDTLLGVYAGSSVDALTEFASNDDGTDGFTSEVLLAVTSGTTYNIAVDGFDGETGAVTINVTFTPGPPNDAFASAIGLNGVDMTTTGTNTNATVETGEPATIGGQPAGASVWWTFTAPVSAPLTITTTGSNFDTVLGVYSGTEVNALTSVAENDDDGVLQTSRVLFPATAGTLYRILVGGVAGDAGSITLRVSIDNDVFSSRVPLVANVVSFGNNTGKTKEAGEPNHAGNTGGKSIWWTWTANATGPVSVSTAGSSIDTLLAVYAGSSVNALTVVTDNDNRATGLVTSAVSFNAVAGTEYQIAVDGKDTGAGAAAGTIKLLLSDLTVNIVASDNRAVEGTPPDNGAFTISLSSPAAADLSINFSRTGSTMNSFDYKTFGSKAVIKAGQRSVTINVVPKDDKSKEPVERLTLTLRTSSAYTLGTETVATVRIIDNDSDSAESISNLDSDEDGFPNELEVALSTNPFDENSTPFNGDPVATIENPRVLRLTVRLGFLRTGRDSIQVTGSLRSPRTPAPYLVTTNVGGVVKQFVLNGKGSSGRGNDMFKLNLRTLQYRLTIRNADLAAVLTDEGLANKNAIDETHFVPVMILFDNRFYRRDIRVSYRARAGRAGMAKF